MADNTPQNGTNNIATDDIGGVHYPRTKIGFGVDGAYADASEANPFPVIEPDSEALGSITVTDSVVPAPAGTGLFVSGASTANSYVAVRCWGGDSAWNVQVTGFTIGTFYFEISLDSTNGLDGNWINVNGRRTGIVNSTLSGNATAPGMYRGNTSGAKWFRLRSVGTLSGTAAVLLRISSGVGSIFLNASIPAGSNILGGVYESDIPNFLFKGRAGTFRIPGRAGTTGARLLSLYNNIGSGVVVRVKKVFVDLTTTTAKAVTVLPPIIRVYKVTVQPTNGTAVVKNQIGGAGSTNANVFILGDASADGALSATALTATLPSGAIVTQEFAPRLITAAGYEVADRLEFFGDSEIILNTAQGIVLALDYTLATQNPATDMWIAGVEWTEGTT